MQLFGAEQLVEESVLSMVRSHKGAITNILQLNLDRKTEHEPRPEEGFGNSHSALRCHGGIAATASRQGWGREDGYPSVSQGENGVVF